MKFTFRLYSKVIQINYLTFKDTIDCNVRYQSEENEKIVVVCIGYADGVLRESRSRVVFIHEKSYFIVENICMDMMFVKDDDSVKIFD